MQQGTCPVCDGSGRRAVTPSEQSNASVMWGYDKASNTLGCRNCGAQRMSGKATGLVPLRADGSPCKHEYRGVQQGRCYTVYTCLHCEDRYDWDSSD